MMGDTERVHTWESQESSTFGRILLSYARQCTEERCAVNLCCISEPTRTVAIW